VYKEGGVRRGKMANIIVSLLSSENKIIPEKNPNNIVGINTNTEIAQRRPKNAITLVV
jgi:hypothetical protein